MNLRRLDRALPLLGNLQTNMTVRRLLLHNAKKHNKKNNKSKEDYTNST